MVPDQYVVEEGRAWMANCGHFQHVFINHQRSTVVSHAAQSLAYSQFCCPILRPSTSSLAMAAPVPYCGLHLSRSWDYRLVLSAGQPDQGMVVGQSIETISVII